MLQLSIAGNVGRDAELRQAGSSGSAVCNFSVGVSGYNRTTRQRETTWVRVAVWGKRGEQLAQLITKGSRVACSGTLEVSEYKGKTQLSITAQDVTWLGSDQQQEREPEERARASKPAPAEDDDQVPFD